MKTISEQCPRMVYMSNPNNPVGYAVPKDMLGKLAECSTRLSTILVVDEAYYEFCGISACDLIQENPYVVVLRTFSKAFGLAGLRLGYMVTSAEMTRVVHKVNNPKNVTMFAKAAAFVALQMKDRMQEYVREVHLAKNMLYEYLQEKGLRYYPSEGNFVLLEHHRAKHLVLFLQERGVLVRDRYEVLQ